MDSCRLLDHGQSINVLTQEEDEPIEVKTASRPNDVQTHQGIVEEGNYKGRQTWKIGTLFDRIGSSGDVKTWLQTRKELLTDGYERGSLNTKYQVLTNRNHHTNQQMSFFNCLQFPPIYLLF